MSISYTQAAIAAFAIAGATATATWNVRSDRLNELTDQVEAYEKAETWNVPETINNINTATNYLNKQLVIIEKNIELTKEIEALKNTNSKISQDKLALTASLDAANQKVADKERFIKSLFSDADDFKLNRNESKKYFGSEVVIALNDASSVWGTAKVTVNNNSHDIKVGSVISLETEGKKCKLVTNEFLDYQTVSFTFLCQKI
ncbi:hypothetical protein [Vibrio nigripulchritudo]|uniref:hypothetical protein n=1 Tax=Vibrio nigripulchritudo TaxID=28173 RepID=UPI0005F9FE60|nr:hypothetical protein [Vibrio nigripulchritudo]KJY73825.1 hypothetical protein TW74_21190 [Vibrio nigripulchritudo]